MKKLDLICFVLLSTFLTITQAQQDVLDFCDLKCTNIYKPVCGTDSKTYTNECLLEQEKCVKRIFFEIAKLGPCDVIIEETVPATYRPEIIHDEKESDILEETAEAIDLYDVVFDKNFKAEETFFYDEKYITEEIIDKKVVEKSEVDTFDDIIDPEVILFEDEKEITEKINDKKMDEKPVIDTFDDFIDPEEILFDDEIIEDIGDKKINNKSEIDTFGNVIDPKEILFHDEIDGRIPKAIDTVDNDVKNLEETLFNNDKIDYSQQKLDEKPKEIVEMTTIKVMMSEREEITLSIKEITSSIATEMTATFAPSESLNDDYVDETVIEAVPEDIIDESIYSKTTVTRPTAIFIIIIMAILSYV